MYIYIYIYVYLRVYISRTYTIYIYIVWQFLYYTHTYIYNGRVCFYSQLDPLRLQYRIYIYIGIHTYMHIYIYAMCIYILYRCILYVYSMYFMSSFSGQVRGRFGVHIYTHTKFVALQNIVTWACVYLHCEVCVYVYIYILNKYMHVVTG